ncbi:MAG: hypothetical protein AAFU79_25940, partial [Myxococcota bacterium]
VGWFWSRASPFGAQLSLWLGTVAGLILFVSVEVLEIFEMHFLYAPPILLSISTAFLVLGSLLRPTGAKPEWAAVHASLPAPTGWRGGPALTLALLGLTGVLVFAFR